MTKNSQTSLMDVKYPDDLNIKMIQHWHACLLVNLFMKKKEFEPYKILLDIMYDPNIPTEFKLVVSWNKKPSKFLLDDAKRDSEEFLNTKLNNSKDLWLDIISQIIDPAATLWPPRTDDEYFNSNMQKPKPKGMDQHDWDSLKIQIFSNTEQWLAFAAFPELALIEKTHLQQISSISDATHGANPSRPAL